MNKWLVVAEFASGRSQGSFTSLDEAYDSIVYLLRLNPISINMYWTAADDDGANPAGTTGI
jgi:hypothetical protein